MAVLRVGTRTSALALAQAQAIAADIVAAAGLSGFQIVGITTKGDVNRQPLHEVGGSGLFTGAVRAALLAGECDVVVHSSKDLPAADHAELEIAYPRRENPADVFYGHMPFAQLPRGARVGTGSPRRAVQLAAVRPDVQIVPIRGNVPTRLARIEQDLDGVILARAGLNRLGIEGGEDLSVEDFVPAAGQGALGVEAVKGGWAAAAISLVADELTEREVAAERAFMAAIGAGCTTPVGVLGRAHAVGLTLHGRYLGGADFSQSDVDTLSLQQRRTGNTPSELHASHELGEGQLHAHPSPVAASMVVDIRVQAASSAAAAAELAARFRDAGVGAVLGSAMAVPKAAAVPKAVAVPGLGALTKPQSDGDLQRVVL
ncbi:MAG: hydroxymethylbilane synthase [Arcanobacterium sp.]|nr:hydroxymethylbilane synthase [Arcanobacterium sp.]